MKLITGDVFQSGLKLQLFKIYRKLLIDYKIIEKDI